MQLVLILLPLAVVMGVWVLLNPYIGVFLFFLNEYVRPDFFFPFLRPIRLTILIELATLLSWIMHLINTKKKLVWPKFNWLFLGFLLVIATTVITAWNNRKAYDTFEAMAIYFMIYIISINVVDSIKRLNQLVWALFLVHFIFAIRGIIKGGYAGGALMGDENDFALAMNMMIPFAFFMFLDAKDRFKKFAILSILVTLTLAVISSMSRGGWVGLMVTVFFCIFKSKKVFVGLFIMIVLGVAVVSFAPQKYWDEIKTITDTSEATAASRISYWKAAVRMFLDYPITGVGADNGSIRMPEYYIGRRDAVTQWGRAFHGTLPQILAELGSLGIIFYLLMVYHSIKYLNRISRIKNKDPDDNSPVLANAIMVSIVSYLTTATFLSTPYYPQIWTLYTLAIILVVVSKTDVSGKAPKVTAATAGRTFD
jgi:probable O-glycosylation ligase (exosortase A-associated)